MTAAKGLHRGEPRLADRQDSGTYDLTVLSVK